MIIEEINCTLIKLHNQVSIIVPGMVVIELIFFYKNHNFSIYFFQINISVLSL